MYRIKMTRHNVGSKGSCKPRYTVGLESIGEAQAAMEDIAKDIEKQAWKSMGMVLVTRREINNGIVLEVKPAVTLFRGAEFRLEIVGA